MKSFKEFLSESVNIFGNASVGTIIVNGSSEQEETVGEQFSAEVFWHGNLYTMIFELDQKGLPTRWELSRRLQEEYPGAIVHNIYPVTENSLTVKNAQRYRPERLSWSD
jgi:hypothetical protein